MTLDQIFMLLCESKFLRSSKSTRITSMDAMEVFGIVDENGQVAGRDRAGTPIYAKVLGKSKVQRIREEDEARRTLTDSSSKSKSKRKRSTWESN